MADVESGLVPKRPNDEGEAICHVRWMVETSAQRSRSAATAAET